MSRSRPSISVRARVASAPLTPALQRVAEMLLTDPEAIAFGTVASVARLARTSPPTVVRLATALGYEGFAELRNAARDELSARLATDAARARALPAHGALDALRAAAHHNIDSTLDAVDDTLLARVVDLLDDDTRRTWVLPSSQTSGVAQRFVDQVAIIGRRVTLLDGSEFRIASTLATLSAGDVVLSMDVPRHELALLRIQRSAVERGAVPVVLTGPPTTALSTAGGEVLTFSTGSVGAFDSLLGLTVLAELIVNELVERRRDQVVERLDALDATWTTTGLFRD
jgi:DNA-binding MurR/RpiR family transcriptional regulator